ncbi:hypothetical protein AB1N83_008248 [Pleurotus pulmonarius]
MFGRSSRRYINTSTPQCINESLVANAAGASIKTHIGNATRRQAQAFFVSLLCFCNPSRMPNIRFNRNEDLNMDVSEPLNIGALRP